MQYPYSVSLLHKHFLNRIQSNYNRNAKRENEKEKKKNSLKSREDLLTLYTCALVFDKYTNIRKLISFLG